jgi:hypothetical protein
MIALILTCLPQRRALGYRGANSLFCVMYFLSNLQYLHGSRRRDNDESIAISAQPIAGFHADAADRDRLLSCLDAHPILAGSHPVAARKERISQLQRTIDIPADPIDDSSGDLPSHGRRSEQVSPHRRIEAALIVQDYDLPFLDIINVITDCAA